MAKKNKGKEASKKKASNKIQNSKILGFFKKVSIVWGNLILWIRELYKTKPQARLISLGTTVAIVITTLDALGRVVSGLDFVQYILNWRANIFNFVVLVGIIMLVILISVVWRLFESHSRFRYFGIIFTAIFIIGSFLGLKNYKDVREEKFIVLIANFDGPDLQKYRVNEIVEDRLTSTMEEDDVLIERVHTSFLDSDSAISEGKRHQADIIIWGWYGVTDSDALVTIKVEYITADYYTGERKSISSIQTSISDINNFTLQQKVARSLNAFTNFLFGLFSYGKRDYSDAIDKLTLALQQDSADNIIEKDLILLYRGNAHYLAGDLNSALTDYSSAINDSTSFFEIYSNRGIVNQDLGNLDDSETDYRKALDLSPGNWEISLNLGVVFFDKKEYARAIEVYSGIIEADPENRDAYHNRGNAHAMLATESRQAGNEKDALSEFRNAIDDYSMAIEIDRKFYPAYLARGSAYSDIGMFKDAQKNFSRAIKLAPRNQEGYFSRGNFYYTQDEYEKAIEDYTVVINKIDAKSYMAYENRANSYVYLGKYNDALDDYNIAILINPLFVEGYINRGYLLATFLGRKQDAIYDYQKVLSISQDPEMIQNATESLKNLGVNP